MLNLLKKWGRRVKIKICLLIYQKTITIFHKAIKIVFNNPLIKTRLTYKQAFKILTNKMKVKMKKMKIT